MQKSRAEPTNCVDECLTQDLWCQDLALQEQLTQGGGGWAASALQEHGQQAGSARSFEWAADAHRHLPVLRTWDARGRRVDEVSFHPSWHALLRQYRASGWLGRPFADPRRGQWQASAAAFYMSGQVEPGHLCPITMTQAAIPILQKEPALWKSIGPGLLSTVHDEVDAPAPQRSSLWIGMGMTEKQGGSDVRSNLSTAAPVTTPGRGHEYLIDGHKWFFSAPMSDAHLVTAKTPEGNASCFYVPRWRPDGSRNGVKILRLKDKVGNRSNSSSEVEFEQAWGVMVGEEGRGIPTIIEMAMGTRLHCVLGSAALLRQSLVQALSYARQRQAFGRRLIDQALMQSVLADLALESEAALVLAMRLARAFESETEPLHRAWKRLMTPAAKFWVCKRAIEACAEAMEVLGGNGYVEDSVLARLYREAPVNSIWEGSGNVMCLDVLRALTRDEESTGLLLEDLAEGTRGDAQLTTLWRDLAAELIQPAAALEGRSRYLVQQLVLLAQGALLRRHSPAPVADAFIGSRLSSGAGKVMGAMDPRLIDIPPLLARALPC